MKKVELFFSKTTPLLEGTFSIQFRFSVNVTYYLTITGQVRSQERKKEGGGRSSTEERVNCPSLARSLAPSLDRCPTFISAVSSVSPIRSLEPRSFVRSLARYLSVGCWRIHLSALPLHLQKRSLMLEPHNTYQRRLKNCIQINKKYPSLLNTSVKNIKSAIVSIICLSSCYLRS